MAFSPEQVTDFINSAKFKTLWFTVNQYNADGTHTPIKQLVIEKSAVMKKMMDSDGLDADTQDRIKELTYRIQRGILKGRSGREPTFKGYGPPGFTGVQWDTLFHIFGVDRVANEIFAAEDNPHSTLKSFAQNEDTLFSRRGENKESFNGSYGNLPEGDRKAITEDQGKPPKNSARKSIMRLNAPKHIVIAEVYVPYDPNDPETVDTHGHAATAEEIEKAAYLFMKDMNIEKVDVQHDFKDGYGYVVESYIAKAGDPVFPEGAWIMGVKVTDDAVWARIEKGEITGFSLAGDAMLDKINKGAKNTQANFWKFDWRVAA